jgi:hypothetical protein
VTSVVLVTWLGWACYAGAAGSLAAYLALILKRQGWRRPWNAAGLVFISLALSQTPFLFDEALQGRGVGAAMVVTFCLLASAIVQTYTALRPRRRGEEAEAAGTAGARGQDA